MNRFFLSFWGFVIIAAMGALALLFAAGVWYMIGIGLLPALGPLGAYSLAWIVAPIVAALSMLMFMYGEQIKRHILDWEYQYGKNAVLDDGGRVIHYENKPSQAGWIFVIKCFVFVMDVAGIFYRLAEEPIPLHGKALLGVVLIILAYIPWPVGKIIYMVANRPAAAVRREVNEVINIADAHSRLKEANEALKNGKRGLPSHMRPQIESPKQEAVFTQALVEQSQSLNGSK